MNKCTNPKLERLLHAYELNMLSDNQRKEFEAHLIECDSCFQKETQLKDASEVLRREPRVQQTVQEIVDEDEEIRPIRGWFVRWLWPDTPRFVLAKPLSVGIMVLIVGATIMRFGSDQNGSPGQQQTLNLYPMRGGQEQVLNLGQGDEAVINFVYDDAEGGKAYQVIITSASGEVVFSDDSFMEFNSSDLGSITVPLSSFSEGLYLLTIVDPSGSPPDNMQEYYFRVRRADSE